MSNRVVETQELVDRVVEKLKAKDQMTDRDLFFRGLLQISLAALYARREELTEEEKQEYDILKAGLDKIEGIMNDNS